MKFVCDCLRICMVNLWKRYVWKRRNIIWLQFELVTFRFTYGGPKNLSSLWFRDFRTCPRALKSIIGIFGNPRTLKTNQENIVEYSWKILCLQISKCWTSQNFDNFGKDGRRQIPTIRLIQSCKSWIWNQYLPETIFSNLVSLWNVETKKPWFFETKKQTTRNQKPRNRTPRNRTPTTFFKVRESPAPST